MCVLFYLSFVCISAYANVYFKTTIIKQNIKIILLVRGPLRKCRSIRSGASGLPYYCAPLVCISVVFELLAVWRHNKPKTKKPVKFQKCHKCYTKCHTCDIFSEENGLWIMGIALQNTQMTVRYHHYALCNLACSKKSMPNASTLSWKSATFFCLISRFSVFNLSSEMNGPDVVAESCTHVPQTFWYGKENKLKLELKLG